MSPASLLSWGWRLPFLCGLAVGGMPGGVCVWGDAVGPGGVVVCSRISAAVAAWAIKSRVAESAVFSAVRPVQSPLRAALRTQVPVRGSWLRRAGVSARSRCTRLRARAQRLPLTVALGVAAAWPAQVYILNVWLAGHFRATVAYIYGSNVAGA